MVDGGGCHYRFLGVLRYIVGVRMFDECKEGGRNRGVFL